MEPTQKVTVYIVADDASVRESLAWLLCSRRLSSESFDSGEAFDEKLAQRFVVQLLSYVLLDVRMAGLSGLAMFERIIGRSPVVVPPRLLAAPASGGLVRSLLAVFSVSFDFSIFTA